MVSSLSHRLLLVEYGFLEGLLNWKGCMTGLQGKSGFDVNTAKSALEWDFILLFS